MIKQNNCGFTLLETLVAMMILSVALVVIMQLFSGGLRSGRIAEDYNQAVFFAKEKMEEILLAKHFTESLNEGAFDQKYRWKAQIEPIVMDETGQIDDSVKLFNIKVDVLWDEGKQERNYEISTIRLGK